MRPRKVHTQGPLLRYARLRCVLTQRELAKKTGLSFRTIYRWEHGESRPRKRHLEALLRAFATVDVHVAGWAARRLGVSLPQGILLPSPPRATNATPLDRTAVDLALLRSAEELDVSPARLRLAVSRILAAVTPSGAEAKELLEALQRSPSPDPDAVTRGPAQA